MYHTEPHFNNEINNKINNFESYFLEILGNVFSVLSVMSFVAFMLKINSLSGIFSQIISSQQLVFKYNPPLKVKHSFTSSPSSMQVDK